MKTFTKFDLPTQHLEGIGEPYLPPKARDELEIARRTGRAPGVLMAEMQLRGIRIAEGILEYILNEEDILFATKTLGAAALNTAWYNIGRGAKDVMSRQLTLPIYSEYGPDANQAFVIGEAIGEMSEAEVAATQMVKEGREKGELYDVRKKAIGVKLGDSALTLASVPSCAEIIAVSDKPAVQQSIARRSASELLENSRLLYRQMNDTNPTLAQLADQDSPLSVYWRKQANNLAYDALEMAKEFKV